MKRFLINIGLVTLLFLLSTSCRLDVVEPEKFGSEINQPIQESRLNYLSYEINAEDYSGNSVIVLNFNVNKSTLFMTLLDHNNGSVKLEIKNSYEDIVFRTELIDDLTSYTRNLSVSNFSRLYISINNFSGKFKIRITAKIE